MITAKLNHACKCLFIIKKKILFHNSFNMFMSYVYISWERHCLLTSLLFRSLLPTCTVIRTGLLNYFSRKSLKIIIKAKLFVSMTLSISYFLLLLWHAGHTMVSIS